MPHTAVVITVSDRSAAGERADASGPVAVAALREAGFDCDDATVVPDGADSVERALSAFIEAGARLIVTTGGTGVGPRDETPEGTRRVITREVPGVAEELRRRGAADKPAGMLSRGAAGVVDPHGVFIVNLPGISGRRRLGHADRAVGRAPCARPAGRERPPVTAVRLASISAESLDLDAHLAAVDDPAAGAVTTFIGRVRDHDPDAATAVVALEYSAHPDAGVTLHRLAVEAIGTTSAIVAVSHRIGRLSVGDAAVVIVVASPHRAEAFDVCRALIEAIKTDLPVWKRQVEADGTTAWKGLGG